MSVKSVEQLEREKEEKRIEEETKIDELLDESNEAYEEHGAVQTAVSELLRSENSEKYVTNLMNISQEDFLRQVPPIYWESITWANRLYTIYRTDPETGEKIEEQRYGLGYQHPDYFAFVASDTERGNVKGIALQLEPLDKDIPVAYKQEADSPLAVPIEITDKGLYPLYQNVWQFTSELPVWAVQSKQAKELQNIFIYQNAMHHKWSDGPYCYDIRQTVFNITDECISKDITNPLFVRIASPGLAVNTNVDPWVMPITINVTGWQEKPICITYQGTDPSRPSKTAALVDATDGQFVPRQYNRIYGNTVRIGTGGTIQSAWTAAAPIFLHLQADFNGVLYAPFNPIFIDGEGCISTGYVCGYTIQDNRGDSSDSRVSHILRTESMPLEAWSAYKAYQSSYSLVFNYNVTNIFAEYSVAYDIVNKDSAVADS